MKRNQIHTLSVIITTYNQPKYLELVLWGFVHQTNPSFEIVIADDGSGEETKNVIEWFKQNTRLIIRHVWHEDNGFRKCTILNKAIIAAATDYLLFTDGDCIPRADFIDVHLNRAREGYFLSGGYFKLNDSASEKITPESIKNQSPFQRNWLTQNGQPFTYKFLKLINIQWLSRLLNAITTTKPTWNGHNVSGWKKDIIAVNGYNETMVYGGLDRELGERLENYGIKGLQIRYSAIVVHLNHPRPYKKKELMDKNRAIRKEVRDKKIVYTPVGINQYQQKKQE
jgi:glycosyltransferase involved in cell wall biosynthesis